MPRLALSLLLPLLLGAVALPTTPAPVAYRLTLNPLERALDVAVTFPAVNEPAIDLVMATNYSEQKNFSDNVRDVRAETADGQPLRVTRPRASRWLVRNGGAGFTLSYRVVCDKDSFMGDEAINELFHPTVLADRSFAWGWSYLIRPAGGALKRLPVRAEVAAPAGQPVRTSWNPLEPLPSMERLAQSLMLAGGYRYYEATLDGVPVHFALAGSRWGFSDQAFIERTLAVARVQTRLMGFYPSPSLLVALEEGSEATSGGSAVYGGLAVYPRPGRALEADRARILNVIAHEHFHLWNGKFTHDDPKLPEGPLKWFSEGFTSYYALLTLLRAGELSPGAFVEALNAEIARYEANPIATSATPEEMGRRYWRDRRFEELAYAKGALLAWLMDVRMRARSHERLSLDDFMRAVMAFSARGESYDAAKLQRVAEALTGERWDEFFRRYVTGHEALPLAKVATEAGLAPTRPAHGLPRLVDDARTRALVARLALPTGPEKTVRRP